MIASFGASTVLLFGVEESPLAQPRNLIMGNLLGAISAVFSFNCFGITLLHVDLRSQLL